MIKYSSGQGELFGHYVYDAVFKKRGPILKDLVEPADFSFVNEICREAYCKDNGRPGWEPERLFKITFLQFLYDISDRPERRDSGPGLSESLPRPRSIMA